MPVSKYKFGECAKGEIYAYTLTNSNGMVVEILNYGGIIRKIVYKNTDVVLGKDSIDEYIDTKGYLWGLMGRNSNRIENSEFELGGKTYKLFPNDGRNNLHGGKEGFDKKIWNVEIIDEEEASLVLTLLSPDGEEGFPGNVKVTVTYTLTKDNSLKIHYAGESDADTVLNMTNHACFNLNGQDGGEIDKSLLWLNSDFYTPNSDEGLPVGEILSATNTPFDFSEEVCLEKGLKSDNEQIKKFGGYDHNFVLNGFGYRKVGKFRGEKTGIIMEIYTDLPGMQVYSGNHIEEGCKGKNGAVYGVHHGICFETQSFPNNLKFSHFPSSVLKKGQKYDTITTYKFI